MDGCKDRSGKVLAVGHISKGVFGEWGYVRFGGDVKYDG